MERELSLQLDERLRVVREVQGEGVGTGLDLARELVAGGFRQRLVGGAPGKTEIRQPAHEDTVPVANELAHRVL